MKSRPFETTRGGIAGIERTIIDRIENYKKEPGDYMDATLENMARKWRAISQEGIYQRGANELITGNQNLRREHLGSKLDTAAPLREQIRYTTQIITKDFYSSI